MTTDHVVVPPAAVSLGAVTPAWLRLREGADAAARSSDLVDEVRALLVPGRPTVIHDLGCGTGSMGRWLAPRLAGEQHWVVYDRDVELLSVATADLPRQAADGAAVTVRARRRDVTGLGGDDLAGASLVTASALLDMLTADELRRFVAGCVDAVCPVLVTLSVIGEVELTPPDPLDACICEAFNAHQRRVAEGRLLLGPDAFSAAVDAFRRRGHEVLVRPSPWELGAPAAALAAEWFSGWWGAACEQRPELAALTSEYAERRLDDAAAGLLGVTVHHFDLLARPR